MYKEYLKKYGNGGDVPSFMSNVITPEQLYEIDANQINSNILTTSGNYWGEADSLVQMSTEIDLSGATNLSANDYFDLSNPQDQVAEQTGSGTLGKLADAGAVAMAGMEMIGDYSAGVKGYKQFFEDNPDNMAYDKKAQTKLFKEARAQKWGSVAEGAGFALGTALTGGNVAAGRLAGNIAEFFAEGASKLFGVGKKARKHMKKQEFDNLTFKQNEEARAAYVANKQKEAKNISEYISGLSNTGRIAYAELGGMLYGPSHSQGGIPIEAEGGEFIVKKSAIDDNEVKTITGTNKQIASKINADAGGKNPFPGAKINMYG